MKRMKVVLSVVVLTAGSLSLCIYHDIPFHCCAGWVYYCDRNPEILCKHGANRGYQIHFEWPVTARKYLPVLIRSASTWITSGLPTTRQQCCLGNHARR